MATIRFDTRFPGYEVLSELGRSNARVLKARHLATGDLVAIKHFALNTDAETLRRFQRESAIMTSIAHPNIVKVREVQLEAELPYLVMELIEGGSLRDLITDQKRLDVPTTIRLGLQMASAFRAIHAQGIVHRDVKPENILYRPLPSGELHFLLTDFGVARLHEQSNTLTGQSLMTYEYASPEQFNDPKGVGAATDYYSFGVVLYECLHGCVPFAMDDHSGIVTFMNKVLTEAPPALAETSSEPPYSLFANVLDGLLKKKAGERLSDPDELTWLLKQAELDALQLNRTGKGSGKPAPLTDIRKTLDKPLPAPTPAPVETTVPEQRPGRSTSGVVKWLIPLLVVLGAGIGLYMAQNDEKPAAIDQTGRITTPATDGSEAGEGLADSGQVAPVQPDTMSRWLAAEARRKAELRTQALTASRNLSVKVLDFRVGLLGGIRKIQLQLDNPSQFSFPSVAVEIGYYKDRGGLYKTEKIFINEVQPYSSRKRTAPDSDRGTRISCKILKVDLPKDLDSLQQEIPVDSLN